MSVMHITKIRNTHGEAKHVMCAFRIPHDQFLTFQDFCNDEYNAAAKLLSMLIEAENMNSDICSVNLYWSTHWFPTF